MLKFAVLAETLLSHADAIVFDLLEVHRLAHFKNRLTHLFCNWE